jgi:DNA modification methylase
VQTKQDWVLCFDLPVGRRKRPFIRDDGAWKKVASAEPAGEVETWNLRVAEDESYTAEGCIVKNCPLQFDIVERLIRLHSMEGETVFDPFAGLMTVPYMAVKMGRRGVGVELNRQYFADGVAYVEQEARKASVPTLFDLLGEAS